jgi:arginine deiminase
VNEWMGEKKQEEKPAEEKERSMSLPMKKSTNNKRNIPLPNRYFTKLFCLKLN